MAEAGCQLTHGPVSARCSGDASAWRMSSIGDTESADAAGLRGREHHRQDVTGAVDHRAAAVAVQHPAPDRHHRALRHAVAVGVLRDDELRRADASRGRRQRPAARVADQRHPGASGRAAPRRQRGIGEAVHPQQRDVLGRVDEDRDGIQRTGVRDHLGLVLARDHVRVGHDQAGPRHPPRALQRQAARRSLDHHHAPLRPPHRRRDRHRPVGRRQAGDAAHAQHRQAIEPGDGIDQRLRRHPAHQPRQDRRGLHLVAQAQAGLVDRGHRHQPGHREPQHRACDQAAGAVDGCQRAYQHPAANGVRERVGRSLHHCSADHRAEQRGNGFPLGAGAVGQRVRRQP